MKNNYKILIILTIIIVSLLIFFLVWWFKFRHKPKPYIQPYLYKRINNYILPEKEEVHKKIAKKFTHNAIIPKVVYMTYHDIDGIPSYDNFDTKSKTKEHFIYLDSSVKGKVFPYTGTRLDMPSCKFVNNNQGLLYTRCHH